MSFSCLLKGLSHRCDMCCACQQNPEITMCKSAELGHTECSVPSQRPLVRLSIHSCLLVLFHFSSASKVVVTGLLTVSGGIGGTVLYAKWDHKFRAAVEKNVPYSDWLLGLALGPAAQDPGLPIKKRVRCSSQSQLQDTKFVCISPSVSGLWWFKEDSLYVTMAHTSTPIPPPFQCVSVKIRLRISANERPYNTI